MTTRVWLELRGGVRGHFSCQGAWLAEQAARVSTEAGIWADPELTRCSLSPSTHCFQPRFSFSPFCTHTRTLPSQVISDCNDKFPQINGVALTGTRQTSTCGCHPNAVPRLRRAEPPASAETFQAHFHTHTPAILAKPTCCGWFCPLLRNSTLPCYPTGQVASRIRRGKDDEGDYIRTAWEIKWVLLLWLGYQ